MAAAGEFALVKEHLEKALTSKVEWVGDHSLYALLADGAARQRNVAGLIKYAQLAEETATRYDHKLYLAISHRAWGVLHRLSGDYSKAESRLNMALALFRGLGTRWQSGLTLVELGQLAAGKANNEAARTYYAEALSLFNQMGAKIDEDRARMNLAELM